MASIIPGSPVAFEGMLSTDELLACIVCLSPTLVGPLRYAVVAHVVGNMEDEGLNIYGDWILYRISLQTASYFLVFLPQACRRNTVGWYWPKERSMKQERRGRAQLLKE